ncbi:MAG: hypothetical protein EP330_00880 [Deltaproteobacteria bacterium]|nr:MAG: hypothetical protein EP330_00880 [Deltaproteobacteria bacterium]
MRIVEVSLPRSSVHPLRTNRGNHEQGVVELFLRSLGADELTLKSLRPGTPGNSSDVEFDLAGVTLGVEATQFMLDRAGGFTAELQWTRLAELLTRAVDRGELNPRERLSVSLQGPTAPPEKIPRQMWLAAIASHFDERSLGVVTRLEVGEVVVTCTPSKLSERVDLNGAGVDFSVRIMGGGHSEDDVRVAVASIAEAKAHAAERSSVLLVHRVRRGVGELSLTGGDSEGRFAELLRTDFAGIYVLDILEEHVELVAGEAGSGHLRSTDAGWPFLTACVAVRPHPVLVRAGLRPAD